MKPLLLAGSLDGFPQCLLAAIFQIANVRANGGPSNKLPIQLDRPKHGTKPKMYPGGRVCQK